MFPGFAVSKSISKGMGNKKPRRFRYSVQSQPQRNRHGKIHGSEVCIPVSIFNLTFDMLPSSLLCWNVHLNCIISCQSLHIQATAAAI